MVDEEKEKGFAVRDKRHFLGGKEEDRKEKTAGPKPPTEGREETGKTREPEGQEGKESKGSGEVPLPEINFSNFIFSLSTSALIHLGEIPDPVTSKSSKSLPMAKQTIDILAVLQEKTKGNLTSDEEALIQNILYDLRMRFVKAKQ